jgi:hypothetical protein
MGASKPLLAPELLPSLDDLAAVASSTIATVSVIVFSSYTLVGDNIRQSSCI